MLAFGSAVEEDRFEIQRPPEVQATAVTIATLKFRASMTVQAVEVSFSDTAPPTPLIDTKSPEVSPCGEGVVIMVGDAEGAFIADTCPLSSNRLNVHVPPGQSRYLAAV